MGHSLCSFILRQIPRRSPTHNAVYFTTTRLGGYTIQIWPAWTQTAFRPVLTVLVPASSLILLAFETVPLFYLQIKQMPIKCKPHTVYI